MNALKAAPGVGRRLRVPRRCWWLLAFPLSYLLTLWAKHNPAAAERLFSQGFYKAASQGISALTGLLPFSLLEFGVLAIAALAVAALALFVRRILRSRGRRWRVFGMGALNAACVFGAGLFLFTVLCGVNYYRRPFSAYSGLEIRPSSVEELYALCSHLTQEANALRAQITEVDENGVTRVFTHGYAPVAQAAREALDGLSALYPVLGGSYPAPKPVFFSGFMSRMELTGVYCPFTMEANVNVACTEYTIPATMCHELSHLRGFMREDEANFIAYLACRGSDDPLLRYSGVMLALVHASNQLYSVDQDGWREVNAQYSDGVRADLNADYWYWQPFQGKIISKVSNKVNDTYLKANNQFDGVKSYGRMVDLLLADFRQNAGAA